MKIEFDWADHVHKTTKQVIRGSSCYSSDREIVVCVLCNMAAGQSDQSAADHWNHPAGCLCKLCVDCRCAKVIARERKAQEEKEEIVKKRVELAEAEAVRDTAVLSIQDIRSLLEEFDDEIADSLGGAVSSEARDTHGGVNGWKLARLLDRLEKVARSRVCKSQ